MDINELAAMSKEDQEARLKSLLEEISESVLGDQVHEQDAAKVPLWELFDSLSFMQFKAELTSVLPIAEEALNFSVTDKPTMELIVQKIMHSIAEAAEEEEKADWMPNLKDGSKRKKGGPLQMKKNKKIYGKKRCERYKPLVVHKIRFSEPRIVFALILRRLQAPTFWSPWKR